MSASVAAAGYAASYSSSSNPALSAASLQAQIAVYQRQLSDCVNCSSANTIQGRNDIQQISSKISAAKAQIQQLQEQPATGTPRAVANTSPDAIASVPRVLTIRPGTNVDVFA